MNLSVYEYLTDKIHLKTLETKYFKEMYDIMSNRFRNKKDEDITEQELTIAFIDANYFIQTKKKKKKKKKKKEKKTSY